MSYNGNGRVNNLMEKNEKTHELYEENNSEYNSDPLQGIQEYSKLNAAFFSNKNYQRTQNLIRKTIYDKSGHLIDPLKETHLKVVMRSVFLQNARNLPHNIAEQINDLDKIILSYCVSNIVNEINQYKSYIEHVNNLPTPLEHPKNLSSAGTKTLDLFSTYSGTNENYKVSNDDHFSQLNNPRTHNIQTDLYDNM
jgi:hypothetical protein